MRFHMNGIYVASKTKHAYRWRYLRQIGIPIISTWIDLVDTTDKISDYNSLWRNCIKEASHCDALILYREANEVLKGSWIELGAALVNGVPVFAVGINDYTISNYADGIFLCDSFEEALAKATSCCPLSNSTI